MWYCKMYFPRMHEIIESDAYGVQGAPSQRKVLPFLESLLSFTELDVEKSRLRCGAFAKIWRARTGRVWPMR